MKELTQAERIENLTQPVTLLHGHTSPETAYVVDDYPYGRALRCKIRYWVETATKGAAKGEQRFVSQTTNPKSRVGEVWNKPKASTYYPQVFLYLAPNGHVKWACVGKYSQPPAEDAFLRLSGIYDQMDDAERKRYETLTNFSRRWDASSWEGFEQIVKAAGDIYAATGELPTPEQIANGRYVSDREYEVACAWTLAQARRLAS